MERANNHPTGPPGPTWIGALLVLLGVIGLAHKGIYYKKLFAYGIDGTQVAALRWVLSLPIAFAAYWIFVGRKRSILPNMTEVKWVAGASLMLGLSMWMHTIAFEYLTASVAGVIVFIYPVFVIAIQYIIDREPLAKSRIIQAVLLCSALFLLIDRSTTALPGSGVGYLLTLATAFTYAIYMVLMGRAQKHPGMNLRPATLNLFTLLPLSAIGAVLVVAHPPVVDPGIHTEIGWLLAGMILLSSSFPFLLMLEGMRRIGEVQTSVISATNPAFSCILASFWLGESVSGPQQLGVALMVSAMTLPALLKELGQRQQIWKRALPRNGSVALESDPENSEKTSGCSMNSSFEEGPV